MVSLSLLLSLFQTPTPSVDVELQRFPPRAAVRANLDFATAHVAYLEARVALAPYRSDLAEWLSEARRLRLAWNALDSAQIFCEETDRRCELDTLRELIGADAFFQGRMPPPVPLWRFTELP